ncbi:helix-turn-helix domain-containing protein [Cohnella luojiensis]|uniref:AraC family transcriptional regulator n=1 Tax=Cohnella luojiensis TaxID=652876 RepID=A0A4Y8LWB5_9BACL|nr:helix-turn-helix domain-containing protein [Cohnella luojiensis]TFE25945.1 AraC family transcriptional regulator [Cohnella luojiensis]
MDPIADHSTKGILQADAGKSKFKLSRYEPAAELKLYIQHYWVSEWDLRGQEPYRQAVLSHPNVNLVFEPGNTRVYGIWEKTSTQVLQDQGRVIAIKFNPAGFYPIWKSPLSTLTNRSIVLREAFGEDALSLEDEVLGTQDVAGQVGRIDRFFLERLPERDDNVGLLNEMVAVLVAEPEILRVEQLAARYGKSARTLQRLFDRYIGVSPKGVIQRYRLHEVAEKIEKGEVVDWLKLSLDMGYYDQAHFIKAFKSILGKSPEEYMRAVQNAGLG